MGIFPPKKPKGKTNEIGAAKVLLNPPIPTPTLPLKGRESFLNAGMVDSTT
jgi:hypothetical protein